MVAHRSRRSFLGAVCGAGVLGLGGCLTAGRSVSVLSAGSLAVVLDKHVGPAFRETTEIDYRGEYYGSKAALRMVEDRQKAPDVVVSADAKLLRDRLYRTHTDWDCEFASNTLGVAYAPESRVADRLANGIPWYEVLRDLDEGQLAISDPDLDPLGYRSIQAFQLAETKHGIDGLTEDLTSRAYYEPDEPQLLAGVEAGSRVAAIAYRNMSIDHGLLFEPFPESYDFADPEKAAHYASATYTTSDGTTIAGSPIVYNVTVIDGADDPEAGFEFVNFLLEASRTLSENGLRPDGFPIPHGRVPSEVAVP